MSSASVWFCGMSAGPLTLMGLYPLICDIVNKESHFSMLIERHPLCSIAQGAQEDIFFPFAFGLLMWDMVRFNAMSDPE